MRSSHVKWISAGDVETMVREIRNRIGKKAEPAPAATSTGIDELERYAALMDRGLITREEFDHKKRQVLGL